MGHDLYESFQCMWVDKYGLHCGDGFYGHGLSAHLREAHEVVGGNKKRVHCRWNHCGVELNLENLPDHVEQVHLGIALRCDICGSDGFSSRDTLIKHRATCSSSYY